jgi:hypothetical protein
MHRPFEVARLGQVLGSAQQHGGVPVMAAAMHAPLVLRAVLEGVEFVHGQRVHVGAEADGARAVADTDGADHAGPGDAGMDLAAEFLQLAGDDVAGAVFLETKLRMGMDIAPPLGHFGMGGGNARLEFHGMLRCD